MTSKAGMVSKVGMISEAGMKRMLTNGLPLARE